MVFLLVGIFICMNISGNVWASETEEKKIFVATIYPVAFILKEIVGSQNSVETLLSPANSPHTFEPKPSDIRKIERAAALFYVGPDLDKGWISKLPAKNKIEMLALFSDEKKIFMSGHGAHNTRKTVDPHFWTDPLLVKAMLDNIVVVLVAFAPENAEIYKKNAKAFAKALDHLNDEITTRIYPVKGQAILLFHPSFNYFIKRYDLHLAGIIEPAPGKEPSPKFIHQTLKKMHTVKAKALFSERQSSKNSVQVLAEAAGVKAYELDPIGGIPGRENYRDLLLYNVQTFVKAFR